MHQQADEPGTGVLLVYLGRRKYGLTGFWDKRGSSNMVPLSDATLGAPCIRDQNEMVISCDTPRREWLPA
jgi:hypothetical protein